ncbi:MAG: rod shape-determining protein MreC [Thermodesulfobacteriota bacterium]
MRKKERPLNRLKIFVLTGLLAVILFVLLVSGIGKNRDFGPGQKIGVELLAPVQKGIIFIQRGVSDFWHDYIYLVGVQKENRLLRKEIERLRSKNNDYREALIANIRLKKLLNFKETVPLPLLSAEVIGYDPTVWFKTMTINRGSDDGLQRGMAVISADGVVGQIISVSLHYAKVLLITDQNSAVDAIVQRSRVRGVLKGESGGVCYLDYVGIRDDVKPGDIIISSGVGGVFPKGLPVGRIIKVKSSRPGLFQDIEVVPCVDISDIEEVLVVLEKSSIMEQ